MESTDTATSHDITYDKRIEPLTQKILSGVEIVETLQELRTLAKGNDWAKGFIGERLSSALVVFVKTETPHDTLETRIEAAKLLRSITVYRKNKTLGCECASIIKVLTTTDNRALKLALTATLWNLSALAENRGIIVEHHGLQILSQLLESGDLGLQREAAGAIRNITLDDDCRESFTDSTLDALINLLSKTDDIQLLVCISGALRNLSNSAQNRKLMATEKSVDVLCEIIKSDNSKLQNLTLAVLTKISLESSIQYYLAKKFTKQIYETLMGPNSVVNVRENTVALLKNLNVANLPESQAEPIQNALKEDDLFSNAKYGSDLLKSLNLEGTISYSIEDPELEGGQRQYEHSQKK